MARVAEPATYVEDGKRNRAGSQFTLLKGTRTTTVIAVPRGGDPLLMELQFVGMIYAPVVPGSEPFSVSDPGVMPEPLSIMMMRALTARRSTVSGRRVGRLGHRHAAPLAGRVREQLGHHAHPRRLDRPEDQREEYDQVNRHLDHDRAPPHLWSFLQPHRCSSLRWRPSCLGIKPLATRIGRLHADFKYRPGLLSEWLSKETVLW